MVWFWRTKMSAKKILIVSPHPDDLELAMAMRAYRYVQEGYEVYAIVLCRGELGGDPEVRESESKKVAETLGITKVYFFNHQNTKFDKERISVKDDIEEVVRLIDPDVVYAPWPNDEHVDHVISGKETLVAARAVSTIIFYECMRSLNFKPNYAFYGGQNMMDKKLEAIGFNVSQIQRGAISKEFVSVRGRYWAFRFSHHLSVKKVRSELNLTEKENLYAEVFHIYRIAGRNSFL
jgi:N-acetylglucosamine malate deacetylase 1